MVTAAIKRAGIAPGDRIVSIANRSTGSFEDLFAVVVLRPGTSATADELFAWCRERMAGYKRPRTIRFIAESEMPRTATGKIQHRKLRERIIQPT